MHMLALVAGLALVVPALCQAGSDAYDVRPDRAYPVKIIYKLVRGVGNVVTSPSELFYNSLKEGQTVAREYGNVGDQCVGVGAGFIVGIGYMLARVTVGVVDVSTFYAPTPPIMRPAMPESFLKLAMDGEDP